MEKIITKSEQETINLAKKFAATLKGGETLCLVGDLGSGKTVFAKGIAAGLGIKKIITSPTFVLMKIYETQKHKSTKTQKQNTEINTLVHIDAYRLTQGKDLEAVGVKDYLGNKNCVTIIEWADRVSSILPKNKIMIEFKVLKDNKREIIIQNGFGKKF